MATPRQMLFRYMWSARDSLKTALTMARRHNWRNTPDTLAYINRCLVDAETAIYRARQSIARGHIPMPKYTSDYTFVNYRLTADDERNIERLSHNPEDIITALVDVIASGHKLSLSYSTERDNWTASFTGSEGHPTNAKMTLSAYSDNALDALVVLLYKHSTCLVGNYLHAEQANKRKRG